MNHNDTLGVESEAVQLVNTQAIYLQDKAMVDVQISTAKAFPRNTRRAMENAITIVTMDKETASTCTYSVPRGTKTITGPSVHLAKILAQCWGNMRIEAKVVDIQDRHVVSQGVAFDLENNLAMKVEVKENIMQNEYNSGMRTGKMIRMNDDMITVKGNSGNSKALRNAIFAVIPRGVVDKVYNEAKKTITGDISDETKLLNRRNQVFEGFKNTYKVSEKEVLEAIGKAAIDHITGDDLVVLIGIAQAIKDGDTTVEQAFKGQKNNPVVEDKTEGDVIKPTVYEDISEELKKEISETKTPTELKLITEANPDLVSNPHFTSALKAQKAKF